MKNSDYTTGMAGTGLIYTIDDAASLDVTNENDIQGIMQMSYFGSDVNGVYGCFMSDVAYAAYDPEDPTVEIANWMPTPTIPSDAAGAFTLRVRAVDMSTWALSDIVTANYTAGDATPVPVPTLTPAAGSKVLKGGKVTVVKPNPDDGFYYDVLYVLDNAGFDFTKYKCYDDDICADGPAVPTGQMYRNPITITKNTTVKVITVKYNNFSGKILGWSEPVTASYIAVDAPAAPTFNPDGGEVEDGTAILLTNGTESDATPMPIYYNYKTAKDLTDIKTTADLDQANRQMASLSNAKLYTSAGIQIKKDQTINAATADIDANGNVIWSAVTTKSFTYKEPEVVKPEAPVFTPDGGTVAPGQKITLTQADGEDIYYCLNGGESNFEMWEYAEDLVTAEQAGSLTLYSASEGITLTENATVWAAAVQFNNDEDETITWSDIISKEFTVEGEPVVTVAIPVITPGNDAIVHMGDLVTIICETEGAEIYYSVGNDKPYTTDKDGYPVAVKEGALKYTEPFALTEDMLIKQGKVYALKINAVAAMGDAISENGAAAGYVVYPNAPEFSPAAGEVEEGTKVTITCIPSQTKIYYTLDGSTPAEETATEYTEPIEITEAMTVKVVAVLGQYQTTGSAAYTIKGETPVTTPVELTFDPASGSEVEEGTAVTITANQEVELFYMMFASEEAAKAAEWDQEKAESYN
ncbi:MAG: chitobiase/beta-hexosaminidase C-terminal domain-containing protein, partial [Bacteroidales bacterium]|nr:chitobiase/beta-hexosaminidase C-terminal domain-containing protein [Bacteroidales bacterium]